MSACGAACCGDLASRTTTFIEGGEEALARAQTKPGKGSYVCSNCGATQELKTAASTLKACPNCGSTLFRKVSGRSSARP
jgi:DNA-directed RNA polymerase subunit RPC12/RpoP